jgi:hypothetical protein
MPGKIHFFIALIILANLVEQKETSGHVKSVQKLSGHFIDKRSILMRDVILSQYLKSMKKKQPKVYKIVNMDRDEARGITLEEALRSFYLMG